MRTATILVIAILTIAAGCDDPKPVAETPVMKVTFHVVAPPPTDQGLFFGRSRSRCGQSGCTAESTPQAEQPVSAAVERALKATVMINNRGMGGGSGVYLGDGLVLTCSHLFRDSRSGKPDLGRVVVSFVGGEASEATLIAEDQTWDLALLRLTIPPTGVVSAALSSPDKQHAKGEAVAACGYGGVGAVRRVVGRITGFGRDKRDSTSDADTMIISGSVRNGDSGGPMFNAQGEVCAVLWGCNHTGIYGTRAARCLRFVGKFLKPRAREPEAATEPPEAVTRSPGCAAEFASLRADVDELMRQMADLETLPGVPGPAGKDGQDGLNGIDGRDADEEAIIKRLQAGIRIPTTFRLSPKG